MSERTFTIEMIDMDLADLDTDEFLGLTPTYLRSILLELKRCYRVIEDIESMIPDNHEEIDPVLSDILSECHRLLGM